MIIVFSKEWFAKHNNTICWFANQAILKYWFRWILRIHNDVKWDEKILKITPNSFTIDAKLQYFNRSALIKTQSENPNETRLNRRLARKILKKIKQGKIEDKKYLLPALKTDFRTHEKFGKRLYYGLKPLWYLLHFWDWSTSIQPALNCGFDTLTVYPDAGTGNTTVDGVVIQSGTELSWGNIVSAAGTSADATATYARAVSIRAGATANTWQIMYRSIFLFNTSSLTSAATISASVMSLYSDDKLDSNSITPNIDVYTSTPALDNNLGSSDYSQIGTTSQTGSPITYAGWSTSGYNGFTFNATGIANIDKEGISKFGVRNANYDVANSAPVWKTGEGFSRFSSFFADQTATTTDPKLVVTYTTSIDYLMSCAAGSYTLTSVNIDINKKLTMGINLGTFALTGVDILFARGKSMLVECGNYVITGYNILINKTLHLIVDTETYSLTGVDVILSKGLNLFVDTGLYILTGIDIMLSRCWCMAVDVGSYVLTGVDTILKKGLVLITSVGEYTLTGIDITINRTWHMAVSVGNFILNVIDVIIHGRGDWTWSRITKNISSWTNQTKNTNSWTNKTKNSSTWVNKNKS